VSAECRPELSRSQARRLIELGRITVNGARVKPAYRLRRGEAVAGEVPEAQPDRLEPEAIPLAIVYENHAIVVVDKPAGMVVHPAPGHRRGTLVHALLHHCRDLSGVGGVRRPGIVHRLDKGTSGLLVACKTDAAHRALSAELRAHRVEREYLAIVKGSPRAESGTIDRPIARHPADRKRFTADPRLTRARSRPRRAVTHWRVEERLGSYALLRVRLETGRTHQVRVHLASIGLPLVGDPTYGRAREPAGAIALGRQALHAARLGFRHPERGEPLRFESPLPPELRDLLQRLRP
jgi:23S rRNA pseudouridine1911/1915/1917 synthase